MGCSGHWSWKPLHDFRFIPRSGVARSCSSVFIFWDSLKQFPRDDTFLHSHQPCIQLPISQLPRTYLLSKQVCDSPTVALIDTSWGLVKSDTFHIPVGICVSDLEKCLFKSLAHIKIRLLLLLSCRSFLYNSVIELLRPFAWSNSLNCITNFLWSLPRIYHQMFLWSFCSAQRLSGLLCMTHIEFIISPTCLLILLTSLYLNRAASATQNPSCTDHFL